MTKRGVIFLAIVLLAMGAGLVIYLRISYYQKRFLQVDVKIQQELKKLAFPVRERRTKRVGFFPKYTQIEERIELPFTCDLDRFSSQIQGLFSELVRVHRIEEENGKDCYQVLVSLGFESKITHILRFFLRKIKLALIIDDFGYSQGRAVDLFLKDLHLPLTISIIPGTPYARAIAEEAKRNGKEVILHLPMQPRKEFRNRYKWIILDKMGKKEIRRITREAIKEIPQVVGLNNHMGSLITAKEEPMQTILEVVKEENLYFVDSRTTAHSMAFSLAKRMGLRSAVREVFLDNEKDKEYIRGQFQKLVCLAQKKGQALGIAHLDETTARTMKSILSQLEKRKIQLVYVSEIVH